jgi:hypothetical protein
MVPTSSALLSTLHMILAVVIFAFFFTLFQELVNLSHQSMTCSTNSFGRAKNFLSNEPLVDTVAQSYHEKSKFFC